MGVEAIFTIDRIFEKEGFEGLQGEGHIAAKEDKGAEAGKILSKGGDVWEMKDTVERELTQNDGEIKHADIYEQDRLLGEGAIGIEDGGDSNNNDKETGEFGKEVVGV